MSFLSARSPLFARGTFKSPKFSPDMKRVATRTGAAVVLGPLLTPLAALLPLIETGSGKDSDCADLLAHLNKFLHPELYPTLSTLGLWLRLPLQGVLMWWAYRYTRQ